MASIVGTPTTFSHVFAGGTTQSVTLNQAATAGSTLVVFVAGGAIVTAKITNSSGAAFTKRTTYGGGAQDVSISDFVAVGGETTVFLTLNGAENISGIIYEIAGAGAFIAAASDPGGQAPGSANDFQVKTTASVAVTGNAVLVGGWSVAATTAARPFNGANQWRAMGPLGKLYANAANQPGANSEFIWASGLADITAAASYPGQLAAGSYQATSVWLSGDTCFTCAVAYTNAGAAAVPSAANPIVAENSLPGTYNGNWFLGTGGVNSAIAGFCDKTSYAPGDTVNFKVDSGNGAFRVEIYRLGYYGYESFGARLQTGNGAGYITGTPAVQPAPTVDATLGSTSCAWSTTATWTIPASAAPGVYYVLFRSTVTPANVASGHFIVRSGSPAGKVAVCLPDMTYQAYNLWGATSDTASAQTGRSLYRIGTDGATANFAHRSYAVNFDRPYTTQANQPNSYLFDSDYGWIVFAEAQGYNLNYLSCLDLDANTALLNTAAAVVMLGHHEYWTRNVYDCFTNAVTSGVNMMSVSSNTALWRTRFAAADTNRRTLICYKDSSTRDVSAGFTGTGYDPVSPTGTWRDNTATNGITNPDRRVEDALTGQLFVASAPSATAMTVPFASKTKPIWRNSASVAALTSGGVYTTPTGVIGDEVDYPSGDATQPANLVNLSPTTYSSTAGANPAGTVYTTSTGTVTAGFTLYRRSSGALVFTTGAWRGWQGVSRWAQSALGSAVTTVDANWQNALLAVLYDLGVVPTAVRELRPATDTALTDPATGAPGPARDSVAIAYGLTVPAPAPPTNRARLVSATF